MMKFEYTVIRLQPQDDLDFLDQLNGMGSQGWEFTGHTEKTDVGETLYFLKRVVGPESVAHNAYVLSEEDHIEQDRSEANIRNIPYFDNRMNENLSNYPAGQEDHIEQDHPEGSLTEMYGTPPKLLTVRERQAYGRAAGSFPASQLVYALSDVETILRGRDAEKTS